MAVATIHSSLYRAGMLATESTFFRLMVQAAAMGVGKEFSEAMLFKCAANYAVLQQLPLEVEGGMDAVITEKIVTKVGADSLDQAINAAVLKFKPSISGPTE